MAACIQLDFFEDPKISALRAEIEELRNKLDRQRKSQFGKIGELKKQVCDLTVRLEIMERNICNGK